MQNLDDLRYFVVVAETRSFTAAADRLHVTVSTVTKHIRKLEDELGVILLSRTTRQLSLTALGHQYYENIKSLIQQIDHQSNKIQSDNSSLEGRVRISVTPTFGRMVLIPSLSNFFSRYKHIGIDVFLGRQTSGLIDGNLDIIMRSYPISDTIFMRRVISTGRRKTVASPKLISQFGMPRTPEDLHSIPCIVNPHSPKWQFKMKRGEIQHYNFHGPLRSDSGDIVRAAAVDGIGVAQSGWWIFEHDLQSGKLISILNDYETEADPLYSVHLGRDRVPASVRTVLDFLCEIGKAGWRVK